MWFISVIFQFYFVFIFMAKGLRKIGPKNFFILSFAVSLSWWVIVVLAGKSDERVWNSFFLQYLWEFSLGMTLADCFTNKDRFFIPTKRALVIAAAAGIAFLGVTGVVVGAMRTINDVPSLIGYGALAILIYSLNIGSVNYFIERVGAFSYEWYLVHILAFQIVTVLFRSDVPYMLLPVIKFCFSVIFAIICHKIISLTRKVINDLTQRDVTQ